MTDADCTPGRESRSVAASSGYDFVRCRRHTPRTVMAERSRYYRRQRGHVFTGVCLSVSAAHSIVDQFLWNSSKAARARPRTKLPTTID